MNIKNFVDNLFKNNYNFSIVNNKNENYKNISTDQIKVYPQINKNLDLQSEGLAIIPTEWESEILCYEFKGKIDNTEFLVYINAETGEEEDILLIVNTPNGILTM